MDILGAIDALLSAYGKTGVYGAEYKRWAEQLKNFDPPETENDLESIGGIIRAIDSNLGSLSKPQECARSDLIEAINQALTGQEHHAISKKVWKALEKHPKLRGKYRYRDSRWVVRAIDRSSHIGNQNWHIDLDNEIVDWITNNPSATQEQFETFVKGRYGLPDLLKRFPLGLK